MRAIVLALALVVAGPAFACSPKDIEVSNLNWSSSGGSYVTVLGQVKNNCATPIRVKAQIIFTARMGRLLVAEEFSPSRNRSIAPGDTAIFSETIMPNETVAKGENWFDLKILEVR